MAYGDFTLEQVVEELGAPLRLADLFPGVAPLAVPTWLRELLDRGMKLPLLSEKARSELIVMPILLASRELSDDSISIYSGQRLDVDPERGLMGECDFLLARTPPLPILRPPLATLVEAKRNDIDLGLGQCAAQMLGARVFNEKAGREGSPIFGCVTTGETWQFLKLQGDQLEIDPRHSYISDVGTLLAIFQAIIAACPS